MHSGRRNVSVALEFISRFFFLLHVYNQTAYLLFKAVRIFAAKSNERRRKSQSISQGPTFISEKASSSGSGENPTTSLEVNANDVTTDEKFTVAPRNAVLQACTLTSSLLLAGGLVLREVNLSA